jgi:hypothetical protein
VTPKETEDILDDFLTKLLIYITFCHKRVGFRRCLLCNFVRNKIYVLKIEIVEAAERLKSGLYGLNHGEHPGKGGNVVRSYLKIIFWPNLSVGASF